MSEKLGRGAKYWESVRLDPFKMTLGSAFKFIEEVGITKSQFYELVGGQD